MSQRVVTSPPALSASSIARSLTGTKPMKTPAESSKRKRVPGSEKGLKTPAFGSEIISVGTPEVKPPHSYVALIYLAMKHSGRSKVTLAEIYDYIRTRFTYYRHAGTGWKNSIRHNLTQQKCFVKVARMAEDGGGKGGFWAPHEGYLKILEERAARGNDMLQNGKPKTTSKSTSKKRRVSAPPTAPKIRPETSFSSPEENEIPPRMAPFTFQLSEEPEVDLAGGDDWPSMPRDGAGYEKVALASWFGRSGKGVGPFITPQRGVGEYFLSPGRRQLVLSPTPTPSPARHAGGIPRFGLESLAAGWLASPAQNSMLGFASPVRPSMLGFASPRRSPRNHFSSPARQVAALL